MPDPKVWGPVMWRVLEARVYSGSMLEDPGIRYQRAVNMYHLLDKVLPCLKCRKNFAAKKHAGLVVPPARHTNLMGYIFNLHMVVTPDVNYTYEKYARKPRLAQIYIQNDILFLVRQMEKCIGPNPDQIKREDVHKFIELVERRDYQLSQQSGLDSEELLIR